MPVISPEALADVLLGREDVRTKDERALFLDDATVVVFDGLVIWRGDLNMKVAIPRLMAIAQGIGLPVAVIEKQVLKSKKSKRHKPGKHCGPANWMKNSWASTDGFDYGLREKYDSKGCEKPAQLPLTQRGGNGQSSHQGSAFPGRGQPGSGGFAGASDDAWDDGFGWFGPL